MNCPNCNQAYAAETFICAACGCHVLKGELVDELPPQQNVVVHGALSIWRFLQLMAVGTVATVAGLAMIQIEAPAYGIFLICVGVAAFVFGIWVTLKARHARPR